MNISINNNNYIPVRTFRQEKYTLSLEEQNFITSCLDYYKLSADCGRKGPGRFMDFLLLLHNNGFSMKIARKTIGKSKAVDLSVKQLSRIIKDMKKMGHIGLITQHKESHTYILNDMFFNLKVRLALRHLLPQLHDEKLSKQKHYGNIVCENKLYNSYTIKKVSDLSSNSEKMSRSLKGYIYIQNTDIDIDTDIDTISQDYTPFNFDTDDIDINISISSTKKERKMKDLYSETIIPYWEQLKSVRPTIWGQVKLSAYPKEIVLHADQVTLNCKKLKTAEDRWKYLFSVCSIQCKENKIETYWPTAIEIGKEMGMPNNGPFFDDTFIPISISIPVSKYNKKSIGIKDRQVDTDKARENEEFLKGEGQAGCLRQQQKHLEEWEHTRINDPVKFTRWEYTAKAFRKQLGLLEDGTFQPGRTAQEAVNILLSGKIQEKVRIDNDINGSARENGNTTDYSGFNDIYSDMDNGILEDYSSDPFGDHQ